MQVECKFTVVHPLHKDLEWANSLVLHSAAPQAVQLEVQLLPACLPSSAVHPCHLLGLVHTHVLAHLPPAGTVQADRNHLPAEREPALLPLLHHHMHTVMARRVVGQVDTHTRKVMWDSGESVIVVVVRLA